jgi:hypothetical protein
MRAPPRSKIARDRGVGLGHVVAQIQKFLDGANPRSELTTSREFLATALDDVQAMVAALNAYLDDSRADAREVYRIGLESVPFLLAFGDLLIGWLLLQNAEIALNALDGDPKDGDRTFYSGKVAVANFFARKVLPRLTADRKAVETVDLAVMDLPEGAF